MSYRCNTDGGVIRLADGACIPKDPANRDWRAFLVWQAAGNTPAPVPAVAPAATLAAKLAATDAGMARVAEDVAVALITGQPVPQSAKDKINARRALRGQPPV